MDLLSDKSKNKNFFYYSNKIYPSPQFLDTTYDTYELLFIDAKYGEWNGTAVKQIAAKGVPLDKIVVGKPVTPADASNTGYIFRNLY
jgi:hypothetical protein